MRTAETILNIIQDRGQRGLPLGDVYRQLYNPTMYLRAYARIQANAGALTQGITDETVDGMSQDKIAGIIEAIRYERWKWTPVRRVEIPKSNGKTRPLGIPTWSDKLVQEVIRSILEAYYEPQFSDHSHGFRPKRGCHTALDHIQHVWMGTKWFIEGDIKGCFDNIDHNILMNILREDIQDNRFLRLIEELLKAGYCEQWTYHPTHSGTPQGGSVSPILANIYMDKLDEYVEKTLIPEHTRGKKRKPHTEYRRLNEEAWRCRKRGNLERAETLRKQKQKLPSVDPYDQDYRRLRYIRHADDFLLGLTGTKAEAEEIKERLATFLKMKLNLTMAPEKTLVTHATQGRARFLGYEIGMMESQTKQTKKRRIVNGKVGLYIPKDVTHKKCAQYTKEGKAVHRPELLHYSEYDTITRYQWEYRGLVEYYAMAQNIHTLSKLHWTMETSLLKTLANKNRTTVRKTQLRLKAKQQTPHGPRACLKLIVPREKKKPLTAVFGGISLRRRMNTAIKDQVITPYVHIRSGVVERLVRDTCEVCGAKEQVEMHHTRKLADLKKIGQRKEVPYYMKIMSAIRRKTIAVCRKCHMDIQHNRPRTRTRESRRAG